MFQHIKESLIDIFKVWRQEFWNVFHDTGVMVFFLLLPIAYPVVYSLIFNPELVREVPMVVVDNSRTQLSRQFVRDADATPRIKIIGYAADLPEAKKAMYNKDCYSIMVLPDDFEKKIGRNEQTNVVVYCDMSLLLRYKAVLTAINQLALVEGSKIQMDLIDNSGAASYTYGMNDGASPISSFAYTLGNTEQGFGSFIVPGIIMLILQQSLLLGIGMLGAGEKERRLKNNGKDPLSINTGIINTTIGRALCYFMIYIPSTIYILFFVPRFFLFPQNGNPSEILLFMIPYLFACIFLGMTVQILMKNREDVFPIVVFASVILLFISGLTWPRYAMSPLWQTLGAIFPSTWGVNGFITMNGNSASLSQMSEYYCNLWILCTVYFVLAIIVKRYLK